MIEGFRKGNGYRTTAVRSRSDLIGTFDGFLDQSAKTLTYRRPLPVMDRLYGPPIAARAGGVGPDTAGHDGRR
jgi:hypothetical protein